MKVGDKVICRDRGEITTLVEGRTYTITTIDKRYIYFNNDIYSGYYPKRFVKDNKLNRKLYKKVLDTPNQLRYTD